MFIPSQTAAMVVKCSPSYSSILLLVLNSMIRFLVMFFVLSKPNLPLQRGWPLLSGDTLKTVMTRTVCGTELCMEHHEACIRF